MELQAILHIRKHLQEKFELNLDVGVLIHASRAKLLSFGRFELVAVELFMSYASLFFNTLPSTCNIDELLQTNWS
jgi:hypothetical protein